MKERSLGMVVVLMLACLLLSACGRNTAAATEEEARPVTIEHLEGQNPTQETLTEEAAKRLGIKTIAVHDTEVNGVKRIVVPYGAILYDIEGATWVYTNPEPLTYVRNPVTVDHITGDEAILSMGPPSGSAVVTVGAEELYGAEFEFQEE